MSWLSILGINPEDTKLTKPEKWLDKLTNSKAQKEAWVSNVMLDYARNHPESQKPTYTAVPVETRDDYDTYKKKVVNYYKNQMSPWSQQNENPQEYYPILNEDILRYLYDLSMKQRKGTEYLTPIQSLYESTGGRQNADIKNLFGTLSYGEGSNPIPYESYQQSIDAQLGPNVLGGGANQNMNILSGSGPISEEDIRNLYSSYNPNSPYVDDLIEQYKIFMGIR